MADTEDKRTHMRRGRSGYIGFPDSDETDIREKYSSALDHIKTLYKTATKSVDALVLCIKNMKELKQRNDKIILVKASIEDKINKIKDDMNDYSDKKNILKKEIHENESQLIKMEKNKKKLENQLTSYLSQVVKDQPKREKIIKKQEKNLIKIEASESQ